MAINGTSGPDTFRGTRFNDEIFGFGGNDLFFGSKGEDRLDGGSRCRYCRLSGYFGL